MESTFYTTAATSAFALLGLWWVVVAERREEWLKRGSRRRQAYTISLYFMLPGIMSLASLVSEGQTVIWRLAFGLAGGLGLFETGAALLSSRTRHDTEARVVALLCVTVPAYLLVMAVAISPTLAHDVGLNLRALQTEGVLVSILILLGVNFAWVLFFEDPAVAEDPAA